MRNLFRTLIVLAAGLLLTGASFAPGEYPGVYRSAALAQSGVIFAGPQTSNFGACEFYNASAAAAWFGVYNSATVAGQAVTNLLGWCQATTLQTCSVTAGGPTGPTINAGIVASNGLSWYGSSTFLTTQTGIGSNGFALCTFNVR